MFSEQGHLNDYKEVWGWEYEPTMNVRKKAMEIRFISRVDYPHQRWDIDTFCSIKIGRETPENY
ncbi:hypothetical protein [Bacillus sp. FSL K6-3431]|uniref:hypothetical protein n=1 Tax=Bacillus sp. FSL K6-3431 TaxID=2921500 RepID=UPI0030F9E64A